MTDGTLAPRLDGRELPKPWERMTPEVWLEFPAAVALVRSKNLPQVPAGVVGSFLFSKILVRGPLAEQNFHQFARFPKDIRLLIWEFALPGPRIVILYGFSPQKMTSFVGLQGF